MGPVSRQVWRVIAAVVAAGALVSGCANGPSQVGAAAIVGSQVLPLDEVQQQIQVALGADKQQLRLRLAAGYGGSGDELAIRQVVTTAVRGVLLDQAAAENGIVISDAQIDAVIAQRGGPEVVERNSLGSLDEARADIRGELIAIELGRRWIDRLSVTFDVAYATSEEELRLKQQQVLAGGSAADAVFTTGPAERGRVADGSSTSSARLLAIVGGIDAGNLLVLNPQDSRDPWTLVRITERRTDVSAAAGGQSAGATAGDELLYAIGVQMLRPLADQLGVRTNPRYGVWDPVAMAVVDKSAVSGVILPIGR